MDQLDASDYYDDDDVRLGFDADFASLGGPLAVVAL